LHCSLEKQIQLFQKNLIEDIASRFDLKKTQIQNLEPHFTLKYWMTVDSQQLAAMERLLAAFCSTHRKEPIEVGGYSGFKPAVIFTQVVLSENARQLFKDLIQQLRTLAWIGWDKFDADNLHFHSTIAEQCGDQYEPVLDFLLGKEKYFESYFDNITIIRKTGEENGISFWETYKQFFLPDKL